MSVDTISDFLTVIRNGLMISKPFVVVPYSKIKHSIANILKDEGFILDIATFGEGIEKSLKVFLKYVGGERVIHEITRVSTPGRRVYASSNKIKPVKGGLGISILSTSKGIMTDKKAKYMRKSGDPVGGEIICTVW
mgnify:CR=1 FL=1